MLYYTILCYTILYYTILKIQYYTILYYTILHYIILYYTILFYTILYYNNTTDNMQRIKQNQGFEVELQRVLLVGVESLTRYNFFHS